jgi:hypothetical protein
MIRKVYSLDKVDPFEMPTETQLPNGGYSPNIERSQLKAYSELVDHPAHYNQGKIEAIDAILDWGLDFIEGNVVKYVVRSRHKSSRLGDLKKARWYLDYLIDKLEKEKK